MDDDLTFEQLTIKLTGQFNTRLCAQVAVQIDHLIFDQIFPSVADKLFIGNALIPPLRDELHGR